MSYLKTDSIQRNIGSSSKTLGQTFNRLSSGKRINRARDDAAGLAIAQALAADAVTLTQANRNIQDGGSALAIAEGALGEMNNISTRLAELSIQAANGTLSTEQRNALNIEAQQLTQEMNRIKETTEFNGQKLLAGENAISIQVGGDSSANSQISIDAANLSLQNIDLSTAESARTALESAKSMIETTSQQMGKLGAAASRLEVAAKNNESTIVNSQAAESRIMDADVAQETAKNVAARIRQQGATALIAQAGGLNKDSILKLLG